MNIDRQIMHNVNIFVPPSNWNGDRRKDVEKLVIDTASHIVRLLRYPLTVNIKVIPGLIGSNPITLYCSPTETQKTIRLSARNREWNKYAYQFAHEFCHVISDHDKLKENPNNWFHEAICELASLFTLRRMSERWRSNAPYPNWVDYAGNFETYCHEQLSDYGINLTETVELHSWLSEHEEVLRQNEYQRQKNALVAYQLLSIFEEIPTGWNAVLNFPTSKGSLKDYLMDWYSLVDEEDKPFIAHISEAFGYTITSDN